MTLRLRLLLVLVGIVAAGLLVADVVTYNQLGSFLYQRTEQQLADSSQSVANTLSRCLSAVGPLPGAPAPCGAYFRFSAGSAVPAGSYGALLDADGNLVGGMFIGTNGTTVDAPTLPASLPGSASGSSAQQDYFSASSADHIHYEVLAQPVPGGGTLVVAFPTADISGTLEHLAWIEALVTLAVLLALGSLAWWIVRRDLRPLEDMAATAGAIAAGDLTQRVPDDGGRTEVGQLGVALNAMLGNIERAFAERAASEDRLRRFLADASHELRTPLTSIRGYSEMFDRGARDRPEDLATSMRYIRAEADRMSELVNDLLLLARLDRERPFEREEVDLGEVVDDAVHAAKVSAPERVISFVDLGPVQVEGDAGRLRQVADNLLANAVRHTPPGTPVEVQLRSVDGSALLEVQDHGAGIPDEEQDRIFEPFRRADPSRSRNTGGMGLGLAIVAAITRAHGGAVGVRSNGSGGATFWVRLPLARLGPGTAPADGPGGAPITSASPPPTA
jgi:two-component system, OmpR family, sensor kinase